MANVKAKKRVSNAIMAVAAVIIVVAGVLFALNLRDGSSPSAPAATGSGSSAPVAVTTLDKVGNVNIERSGLGYALENDATLQDGDIVETLKGSRISVARNAATTLSFGEKTEAKLGVSDAGLTASLTQGILVVIANEKTGPVAVTAVDETFTCENGVFTCSVQGDSIAARAYAGTVKAAQAKATVEAGKALSVNKGTADPLSELSLKALNESEISLLMAAAKGGTKLAFSADDLQGELDRRAAEKAEANKAGGDSSVPSVTIEIRCDTILSNMAYLEQGKSVFVPANGVILATSRVQISEGDTAFDVLKAACSATGIQLEYSFTPLYNAYYIEGINNLYEFDCGEQSGWMYKVNGWFPNYGCSQYEMSDGDVMVWCYTCNGLGADVGGGF